MPTIRPVLRLTAAAVIGAILILSTPAGGDVPNLVTFGGVLRNEAGEGWHILNDPAHHPYGLGKVTCNRSTGEINVRLVPPALGIVYASVDADETYVRAGYATGASVLLDRLRISFSREGRFVPCRSRALWLARSNVWIGGVIEQ